MLRRIIVRKSLYRFWKAVYQMSLRGLGVLNYENPAISGEANFLKSYLGKPVMDRPVVLDVGANNGSYAALIKSTNQNSIVYAFEPHPRTFERLQTKVEGLGITCFNYGFGQEENTKRLFDYADSDGSEHASLYEGVFETIHHAHATAHDVLLRTLDSFVEEYGMQKIDLLKIDTEGHELDVLLGAANIIRRGIVKAVHFEFNEMNIISGVTFLKLADALPGYSLYRMLPDGLVKLDYVPILCEIYAYQNIVALLN